MPSAIVRESIANRAQDVMLIEKRASIAFPMILVFAAFVIRIVNITTESLWRDEVDAIRFAMVPIPELFQNLLRNGFNGPLYQLLIRVWLSFSGTNDFGLRYFSLVFGVIETALIYALAVRLFNRATGIVALWFAVISPVLIWYSGEGKMYSLQPAMLLLALYSLRMAIDGKGARWWAVFIISVSFAYYVHLLTPLFLSVAVIFYFAWFPRARTHWRGALISLAACTLPYIPLAVWQFPTLLAGSATGHDFYGLDVMFITLFSQWALGVSDKFLAGVPGSFPLLAILASVGIALSGFFIGVVQRRKSIHPAGTSSTKSSRQTALGMLAWTLIPAVLIYLISTRAPVFEPRYLLWCVPAMIILIGHGISGIRKALPMVTVLLFIAYSAINLTGFASQVIIPIRPDIRGAARFVALHMASDDVIVFQIPYTRYGFEYYMPFYAPQVVLESGPLAADGLRTLAGLRDHMIDAPFTNSGSTPGDVAVMLKPLTNRSSRIWLVESESAMWDERQMVRKWYDENMKVNARMELHGITVTYYELP